MKNIRKTASLAATSLIAATGAVALGPVGMAHAGQGCTNEYAVPHAITKVDPNGRPLAGATFRVEFPAGMDASGSMLTTNSNATANMNTWAELAGTPAIGAYRSVTVTTDAQGKTPTVYVVGNYSCSQELSVTEVKAPSGYVLDATTRSDVVAHPVSNATPEAAYGLTVVNKPVAVKPPAPVYVTDTATFQVDTLTYKDSKFANKWAALAADGVLKPGEGKPLWRDLHRGIKGKERAQFVTASVRHAKGMTVTKAQWAQAVNAVTKKGALNTNPKFTVESGSRGTRTMVFMLGKGATPKAPMGPRYNVAQTFIAHS